MNPAWGDLSCSTDSASTASSSAASRGLCNQRNRISAARESEAARSRRPRSISVSEGGLRRRRVARAGDHRRARSLRLAGVPLHAGLLVDARTTLAGESNRITPASVLESSPVNVPDELGLVVRDDLVDDPVLPRILGCHEVVALHVLRDPLERLTCVLGDDLFEATLDANYLARLDLDVGCLPFEAGGQLVDHDPCVR